MSGAAENSQVPKMSDAEYSKLPPVQKMYIKRVERFNKGRATDYKAKTSRVKYVGLFFAASVVGIYFYTMASMKQEKLGEEYDQRATDISSQKQ